MARRKNTNSDSEDRYAEAMLSRGRIEEKLDNVVERLERFESTALQTMRDHEILDNNRFKGVNEVIDVRMGVISDKVDKVIEAQSSMSGSWKVITIILTAVASFGGMIATAIHYLLTAPK